MAVSLLGRATRLSGRWAAMVERFGRRANSLNKCYCRARPEEQCLPSATAIRDGTACRTGLSPSAKTCARCSVGLKAIFSG
jgi:hypothetical protein